LARKKKLLSNTSLAVGIDSTMLEANAAMKNIVRNETGEDWKEYLKRLMQEEGLIDEHDDPTDEELRKYDRKRQGKTVSNEDWESPADDDARIVKMKDGRTHLGYKAEHVVDLKTEFIIAAKVYHGTEGDHATLINSVVSAQQNLADTSCEARISNVTADKGYHSNQVLQDCYDARVRSYIPEPERGHRNWENKPEIQQYVHQRNACRTNGIHGKQQQRLRGERVERSFAHMCETGGARRSWLRGIENINKRYGIHAAARNLGLMMRSLFGMGTPRGLQGLNKRDWELWDGLLDLLRCLLQLEMRVLRVFHATPIWKTAKYQNQHPAVLSTPKLHLSPNIA